MTDQQPPPPPYGEQPPVPAYGYLPVVQKTHGSATTALVLGILSLLVCGLGTGIPAIFIGRNAMKEIDASNGRLGGRGAAQAGFVLGIISTVITGIALLVVVLVFLFGGQIRSSFETTCNSVSTERGAGTTAPC